MKTIEAHLNGETKEFNVIKDPKLMFKQLKGEYIKVGSAYCPIDDLGIIYNWNVNAWLEDKLN